MMVDGKEIINLAKDFAKEMKNGFEAISPKVWGIFGKVAIANAVCYLFFSFFSLVICCVSFFYLKIENNDIVIVTFIFSFICFCFTFPIGIWYLIAKDYWAFKLIIRLIKHGQ